MFHLFRVIVGTSAVLSSSFLLRFQNHNMYTSRSSRIVQAATPTFDADIVKNDLVERQQAGATSKLSHAKDKQNILPIAIAIQKMQKDMDFLDNIAGRTPQLTSVELAILIGTVTISALSPALFNEKVVELLVPSLSALSAAVGISAEYVGKVAVANGKEIAALAIQAAAESEVILAQAERVKAVLPLCVGTTTAAAAFSLLAPSLAYELKKRIGVVVITEVYLICPVIALLSLSVAKLAAQDTRSLVSRAIGVGNRRFASSKSVGRTWLSASEQVELSSKRMSKKWTSFVLGVAPAPLIAALIPGGLGLQCVVATAVATAQTAYYLSAAEYAIATGTDAIAVKQRSAAVADTYANQGARSGAILPFTSALAGLCAAATAASVELLPFIHSVPLQGLLAALFPSGAALFAAAATVSKARSEVDAAAASSVASNGLTEEVFGKLRDPNISVLDLLQLTLGTTVAEVTETVKSAKTFLFKPGLFRRTVSAMAKTSGFGKRL